ncbi:hypothetical protein ACFU6S_44355 [Streptomyces sp. NPDC057456]
MLFPVSFSDGGVQHARGQEVVPVRTADEPCLFALSEDGDGEFGVAM